MLVANSVMCQSFSHLTVFEDTVGSWRTAEAWHYERPWKAIGESAASDAIDSSGLKGSCNGVEA